MGEDLISDTEVVVIVLLIVAIIISTNAAVVDHGDRDCS